MYHCNIMRTAFAGVLPVILAMILAACPQEGDTGDENQVTQFPPGGGGWPGEDTGSDDTTGAPTVAPDPGMEEDGVFVPGSKEIAALGLSNPVVITFNGKSAPTVTQGAADATTADVTVTLTAAGADIVVQGVTEDGSLTVKGDYAFNLYLNGASVTNADGAAFNNEGGGKATVTLVSGTTNRFYDTAGNSAVNAAFYSNGALTFAAAGSGTLELRGRGAKKGHAIAAKGAFTLAGGTVWVKEAAGDGVNAAASIDVTGGSWTSRTAGDGLQGDYGVTITGGEFSIITQSDQVKAHGVKSDGNIRIGAAETAGLTMTVTVYGGGAKCLNADGGIDIHSGTLTLNTKGDGFWDEDEEEADKTTGCAGLKCDGNLLIDGGSVTIVSTGTGGKGISAGGDIAISGGSINVTTTGATYKYSDDYDTKSKAIKSGSNITISGGTVKAKTYTAGAEGLECEYTLTISGGDIELETRDDSINASDERGEIIISGGTIFCNSSMNDGIDSNGTISISGGTIVSLGGGGPEEGFDCDNNTFTITGGLLVGLGGATSKPVASDGSRCALEANVDESPLYRIEDADGKEVLTFRPSRTYSGTTNNNKVCILFSSPDMKEGTVYTLYSGGSAEGGTDFHGILKDAAYTKGTLVDSFTAASPYALIGTSSFGPGGGGGFGPGGGGGRPPKH